MEIVAIMKKSERKMNVTINIQIFLKVEKMEF